MAVRSRYAPAVILSGSTTPAVAGRSLNEAALALSRSLGRRGVRVVRFHPDRSLADLRSRYCTHQLCADLDESPDALVAELVKFARRESSMPVLFPASEAASRFVAGHERFLQPYFRLTSPPEECLERVQDRRRLIELARQASIGVPDTYFPESIEDVLRIAEEIDYPVIVRPLRSGGRRSALARQVRATRVDSARELSVIARMFSAAEPVVV
jgi:predicted ATP-grasp superfamily ATP-dependent carboligase